MKKLSLLILVVVGLMVIALLVWFYSSQPVIPDQVTTSNRPPTWTNDVTNELVVVQLNPTGTNQYSVDVDTFGTVIFNQVGETQTINQRQLKLVSVTETTAQVLISTKSGE